MHVHVNIDNLVNYANNLEKLGKSAFPVAMRGTINGGAYSLKKNHMPKKAKEMFEERQPNFFKANSKVFPATGFDVKTMYAEVGFLSSGLHNASTNYAVKDLEKQEDSGIIRGRSFKPLPEARRSGTGNVRANSRISQILKSGNVVVANESRINGVGKNGKMQQFIKASIHAGVGGYVLGGNVLWKVTRLRRLNFNHTTEFKKQKLYSFKKDGTAKVRARGFIRAAALDVQKEMEMLFRIEFQKQWKKVHGSYNSFY